MQELKREESALTRHRRYKSSPVNGLANLSPSKRNQQAPPASADDMTAHMQHFASKESFPVLGEARPNNESKTASPKKGTRKIAGITNLFSNNKTPQKGASSYHVKDKENTTPPTSSYTNINTPIWAQFSSQALEERPPSNQQHTSNDHKIAPKISKSRPITAPLPSSPTKGSNESQPKGSKVQAAVQMFNGKAQSPSKTHVKAGENLDAAFEEVLISRNIPEQMRQNMRSLDPTIKADFIKNNQVDSTHLQEPESPTKSSFWGTLRAKSPGLGRGRSDSRATKRSCNEADDNMETSPSKRSRSRGRTFTFSRGDRSTSKSSKRARSNSRPRSLMSLKNLSSSSVNTLDGSNDSKEQSTRPKPDEFVDYLREERKPERVEVGRLHKLRLLLRNESVSWVDKFIQRGGMVELLGLLKRIMQLEWREEHEDLLLHQVLLCLKALSTTQRALDEISKVEATLFTDLLTMIFDEERKGPSEFTTRGVVTSLLFIYLGAASQENKPARAKALLSYLSDPQAPEDDQPISFVLQMHQKRPYKSWCREVSNVTKEIFWIFLHHYNVVPAPAPEASQHEEPFVVRHFPKERPPVPAAPYVGGPEWEATNYIASHLDLMNGLISSLKTREERNAVREELRASGFEHLMGRTLRLCKEKFYGAVHDGLKSWIAAASEDGWEVQTVRQGPPKADKNPLDKSPAKTPKKEALPPPPQMQLPQLNLG